MAMTSGSACDALRAFKSSLCVIPGLHCSACLNVCMRPCVEMQACLLLPLSMAPLSASSRFQPPASICFQMPTSTCLLLPAFPCLHSLHQFVPTPAGPGAAIGRGAPATVPCAHTAANRGGGWCTRGGSGCSCRGRRGRGGGASAGGLWGTAAAGRRGWSHARCEGGHRSGCSREGPAEAAGLGSPWQRVWAPSLRLVVS